MKISVKSTQGPLDTSDTDTGEVSRWKISNAALCLQVGFSRAPALKWRSWNTNSKICLLLSWRKWSLGALSEPHCPLYRNKSPTSVLLGKANWQSNLAPSCTHSSAARRKHILQFLGSATASALIPLCSWNTHTWSMQLHPKGSLKTAPATLDEQLSAPSGHWPY